MPRQPVTPRETVPGIPDAEAILAFVDGARDVVGKREIAKAFGVLGSDKIALKALIKQLIADGKLEAGDGRALHRAGGLPKVAVLRVTDSDGDGVIAVPDKWERPGMPPPRVRVVEQGKRAQLGIGDCLLARIERHGESYRATVMRKLEAEAQGIIGVLRADTGPGGQPLLWLQPADKKQRRAWPVSDAGVAGAGDLVLGEVTGRPPRQSIRVTQRLGDPFAPRALSLIAIHKYDLPHVFSDATLAEAELAAALSLDDAGRQDLTHLPIVAIDPIDARDHDDALWAAVDSDPANVGGYQALIAIADVSFYVRPGSLVDKEARRRGNSVYFPDQVVPMLPHSLSSSMCSLKAGDDRAALVCHVVINKHGKVTSWRFARARVRLAANLAYEAAQAMIDAGDAPPHLTALWAAWRLLAKARSARAPLNLDLPERQVRLDEAGRIASVDVRERLDAHRLVEDFMIAANVAAAKALEAKKAPVMYRVHEPPSREKLVALKEFLATYEISFALGQVMTPAVFNRLLGGVSADETRQRVMEQLLRTQTQAYYGPVNAGHFGLSLGSYAHFTSPIRRYADLLVHRSLVGAYGLESAKPSVKGIGARSDLPADDAAQMPRIGQAISGLERRAMEAERETVDRYVAAYLAEQIGELVEVRITGVQPFGIFAQVAGIGGDGLLPVSSLGREYFRYDAAAMVLEGEHSGTRYAIGQTLQLRLIEASPISGALVFALPDVEPGERGRERGRERGGRQGGGRRDGGGTGRPTGPRGRPANIRHQGRGKPGR